MKTASQIALNSAIDFWEKKEEEGEKKNRELHFVRLNMEGVYHTIKKYDTKGKNLSLI